MRTTRRHIPRVPLRFRFAVLMSLLVFGALNAATVLHPIVHHHEVGMVYGCGDDHQDDDCGESGEEDGTGHESQTTDCLIARCLALPEIAPEVFFVTQGLEVVGTRAVPVSLLCVAGTPPTAVSRGPPPVQPPQITV